MGRPGAYPDGEIQRLVSRLGWRQGAAAAFANLDGALFLFVYTAILQPDLDGTSNRPAGLTDLAYFSGYLLLSGSLVAWLIYRRYRSATRWLEEGQAATDEDRDRILRFPLAQALTCLVAWVGASAIFPLLSVIYGSTAREVMRLSVTILLGGLVTSALAFLFVERVLRPLFALALAGEARLHHGSLGVRPRLLITWGLASGVPLLAIVGLQLKADGADVSAAVVALAGAGLGAGLLATKVAAHSVSDPLDEVRAALARVQDGDLEVQVTVDDAGEVGRLQAGVNQMVDGLRERHRLADLFGRHVGVEVARRALVEGAGLDSEQREASALFVDIVGSTAMAEVLAPQQVVDTLNVFFGEVVAAVGAEGGWVNKFEGDGALCIFGAPATQPDHAARALRAARRLHERLARLGATYPGLDAAVGVSSGLLVAGNVGTEQRYEYTVIGRPVNEAARLSELAKSRDARLLASAAAIERAGGEGERWRSLGTVALRGQQAPTAIYEPAVLATVGVAAGS